MIQSKENFIKYDVSRQLNTQFDFSRKNYIFKLDSLESKENLRRSNCINNNFLESNRSFGRTGSFNQDSLKYDDELVCPECGSTNFTNDFNTHELLCECGCVIDENFIHLSLNSCSYTRDGINKTHNSISYKSLTHDNGLSTDISTNFKGVSEANKLHFHRLRKFNNRTRIQGNKSRNLVIAFSELSRVTSILSLKTPVYKSAGNFYRKSLDLNLIHGRSIESIMAACIYLACRKHGVPRSPDEISAATNVNALTISRNYKLISRKLGVKCNLSSPKDYIPRFISNLGLSNEVEIKALDIIDLTSSNSVLIGKNPTGLAAAAIYLACRYLNVRKSQSTISEFTNVSSVTIRKRYKELNEIYSSFL